MTREEICKDNFRKLFGGEALSKTGNDAEMMNILKRKICQSFLSQYLLKKRILKGI